MLRRPVLYVLLVLTVPCILLAAAPAGAQVTALTLGQDKPSPQQVGTTVTFTADASGGVSPYEYKFWLAKGAGAYVPASPNYVPQNTMVWTPTEPDSYKVMVYARSQGSTALFEKSVTKTGYWVVTEAPVTAVTMTASKLSPQQAGTMVTFTAAASGGGGTDVEYEFLLAKGGGAYRIVKEYLEPGSAWTPAAGDMDVADSYVVKVNARNQGSTAPFEKYVTKDYVMMADAPVKSVSLNADKTSPQDLATVGTVTFTAVAVPGGAGDAVEYQFWLYTSASAKYDPVGDVTTGYSAANTWHWTPTVEDNYYKVMVYARTVGNTVAYEKLRLVFFTIFSQPPTLGEVIPTELVSPADSARTISAVYSDQAGYEELKTAELLVNETASDADGIFVRYVRALGKLYLVNDAGTAYVGNCMPGAAVILTNSQGSLNCVDTTVLGSGNDLTIHWSITPKAAFVSTTPKNIYTHVKDNSYVQVGWTDQGDWTITNAIDFADCVCCHGNPSHPGSDGISGNADDAPNVMGDGMDATGTGGTPKPYDDGAWGFNVNGHGANGTADHTPKQQIDPGPPPLYSPYLTPNRQCADCHDISLPASGNGQHFNGILNSVEQKLDRSENTAHLRVDGSYPFIVSGSSDWDPQVGFDRACWLRCHQSSGVSNMRHAKDLILAPAPGHETNFNNYPNAVHFGDKGSRTDGQNIVFPIDTALTTHASSAGDDFAPCITCHNPHGTATIENIKKTNRMVRVQFFEQSTLCHVCHL